MHVGLKIAVAAIIVLVVALVIITFFTSGMGEASSAFSGLFDWFKGMLGTTPKP